MDAKCIIDVGANIGFHANLFSKINPNAQIYAFEPAPLSYSYLQRNIALNGLGSKVYTFNYGLSDTLESVKLVIPSGNSANASQCDGHTRLCKPVFILIGFVGKGYVLICLGFVLFVLGSFI